MIRILPSLLLCLLLAGGCEPDEEQRARREAEQRADTWRTAAYCSFVCVVIALIGGCAIGSAPRNRKDRP